MIEEFAYPWVLALWIVIGAVALWRALPRRRRARQAALLMAGASRASSLPRSWRQRLDPLPRWMMIAAAALAVVALARPRAVDRRAVDVEGIDIYLVLDMSGSMRAIDLDEREVRALAARGVRPADRFATAVERLVELVRTRQRDRIGMVVFAREAYLQFPLTLDYPTIVEQLERLRVGDIPEGGTAIGNALARALAGLRSSEVSSKNIILITDGARQGGNISPNQAAELARELGVKVYSILVGRQGSALVEAGKNPFTGRPIYRSQEASIDPELLASIARTSGGAYFRATDAAALERDLNTILDEFERSRIRDRSSVEYVEEFEPWLWAALLLLAAAFILRRTALRRFP